MKRELVSFQSGDFSLVGTCDWPEGPGPWPLVFYCHGFTGHRIESRRMYARLGAMLAAGGIASFRFDHRGCGESSGDFFDFTPTGMLQDLDSALESALQLPNIALDKIAVVGFSLGGAGAAYVLAKHPQFLTAALWAPVARPEIIRERLSQYPSYTDYPARGYFDYGGFRVNPAYLEQVGETLKPLEWIRQYTPPLLLLQGEEDDIVRPEQAELYRNSRGNPEDDIEIVAGADHTFQPAENIDHVLQRTHEWLRQKLL